MARALTAHSPFVAHLPVCRGLMLQCFTDMARAMEAIGTRQADQFSLGMERERERERGLQFPRYF
jgi:hypothetical protein